MGEAVVVKQLTEDEFYTQYKPIPNPRDGSDFWDPDIDYQTIHKAYQGHIWTVVDGEDDSTLVLSGWHVVNRFAFMLTERPWDISEDITVELDVGTTVFTIDAGGIKKSS